MTCTLRNRWKWRRVIWAVDVVCAGRILLCVSLAGLQRSFMVNFEHDAYYISQLSHCSMSSCAFPKFFSSMNCVKFSTLFSYLHFAAAWPIYAVNTHFLCISTMWSIIIGLCAKSTPTVLVPGIIIYYYYYLFLILPGIWLTFWSIMLTIGKQT